MAGNHSEADVFAIPDFWKTSQWLTQLASETSASLIDPDLKQIRDSHSAFLPPAPTSLETEGFFKLPEFQQHFPESHQPELHPSEPYETSHDDACTSSQTSASPEPAADVWMESMGPPPSEPASFRTWEAFNTGQAVAITPSFLSEAGAGAYDALLSWPTDSLGLGNTDTPVVQTKAYFASLLSLSLGRGSVFFTRSLEDDTFSSALPEFRISGYTRQVLHGVEKLAMQCGSTYLHLAGFSRSLYASSSSRCAVALASAINQILQAVEYRVTVDGRCPRSLLELQAIIKEASIVLRPLKDLAARMPSGLSDEDVLTLVFEEASTHESNEAYVRGTLCEILRRVSVPWIEAVEEWLGTRHESGLPFTKSSIGESKIFVTVDVEVFTDDFGREIEDVDFRLDARKVPSFLPMDVAQLIFETGKNLRFVRAHHPDHPLSSSEVILSNNPPKAEWQFGWDAVLRLEKRVEQYRESMLLMLEQSRLASSYQPNVSSSFNWRGPARTARTARDFELNCFGVDEDVLEKRLLESMMHLDQPLSTQSQLQPHPSLQSPSRSRSQSPSEGDSLGRLVRARGFRGEGEEDTAPCAARASADNTPHWSLVALLSFGGIASVQAEMINRESLRLLFEKHGLQAHLNLHRDFHLLRNGLFCSRLSHALFDPDLESAERRTGVAMQGGIMGLRLGGRDTWPPASSELRLALMGVLSEAYEANSGQGEPSSSKPPKMTMGSNGAVLPGDLSFAVRDLSEEEIDKCMDPDTLEALDFLRLSYTTPPELACIITPLHLMHYDRIFKLLLRTLRMLYVVNQLYRDTNSRSKTWFEDNASYRFVRESQHFVSSIASYFLDSGIALPWQAFDRQLDSIRTQLSGRHVHTAGDKTAAAFSPTQVQDMHSVVLQRIMFSLFLRKRQQPLLKLLEEIFTIILAYARQSRLQALGRTDGEGADHQSDPAKPYAELRKKLQVFITVCRGLSEKTRAGGGGSGRYMNMKPAGGGMVEESGVGDDSLIAQLLTKLDLGGYYCRY
ncbi:hypothetical protein E4U43_007525 [Claviceps pusilla]|uniref:Spindle pole body component n=1 Tax=Claviceps pusilla TaxID=123648 RepID=A0A9P7NCG1_9HYPO|nr:hypothetical protein E4U43_007525 [Claviceps pusilla]